VGVIKNNYEASLTKDENFFLERNKRRRNGLNYMGIKEIFHTWKQVFSNWKYFSMFVLIALLFYGLNVLLLNFGNLLGLYPSLGFLGTGKLFFLMAVGFRNSVRLHSYISLIIISILLGMLFSLIIYKIGANVKVNKKTGFFAMVGVFLASFVPGCAACGIGLASALGIGAGFISFFPYDGLELSILSISILGFTLIKITKDLSSCNVCKIELAEKR